MEGAKQKSDSIFVKVEGYRVILQDLEVTKQIIANLKEAISVLNRVAEVKEKSISTFMDNISKLNDKLGSISTQLPDVRDSSIVPEQYANVSEPPQGVIRNTVNDLRGELDILKDELSRIS